MYEYLLLLLYIFIILLFIILLCVYVDVTDWIISFFFAGKYSATFTVGMEVIL